MFSTRVGKALLPECPSPDLTSCFACSGQGEEFPSLATVLPYLGSVHWCCWVQSWVPTQGRWPLLRGLGDCFSVGSELGQQSSKTWKLEPWLLRVCGERAGGPAQTGERQEMRRESGWQVNQTHPQKLGSGEGFRKLGWPATWWPLFLAQGTFPRTCQQPRRT